MGRPLKISKYSPGSGDNNGVSGSAVPVDIGFPNFNSLTDPVYNAPTQTLNGTQFLGVVGGVSQGQVSATYPIINVTVNIVLASGSAAGVHAGRIIRQKGNHKYLVQDTTTLQDENILAGNAYMITSLGTTNWQLFGAPATAGLYDIFTATANGSNSGDGTCTLVGVCILVDDATPSPGYMNIGFSYGDGSSNFSASNLTNKWIRDWNGTTGDYSDANTGTVNYTGEVYYAANFFTDEGTVTKSGAETDSTPTTTPNGTVPLALVDNVTS